MLSLAIQPLRTVELARNIFGDVFVKRSLFWGKLVIDRLGNSLGEQRLAFECQQIFFYQAAHTIGHVRMSNLRATPRSAEPVGINKRHEQLEINSLAVMGRCSKQQ